MKKTNIEAVRGVAEAFLYQPMKRNPQIPFLVSHPFLDSVPTMIPGSDGRLEMIDPAQSEEDFQKFIQIMKKRIQAMETPIESVRLLTKPYRFTFLDHIRDYLSDDDLARCLRCIWKNSEYTNDSAIFTKRRLLSLFRRSTREKLMDEDDLLVFQGLPERIGIFRGVTSYNRQDLKVFSWTLSLERARWFAARYDDKVQEVYQAELPKEGVLAYFSQEEEIIANPFMLENIVEYKTIGG